MCHVAISYLQNLRQLAALPPGFFAGQSQLASVVFDSSNNLGAEQHLPDALFKGLTSLATLSMDECGLRKLPNLDNLTALISFKAQTNQVHMNDAEIEAHFNGLVSVETLIMDTNHLTRIPSVKNMQSLRSLWLANNRITSILPGDFKGAEQLVGLTLGSNRITSAAPEAFADLAAFRVDPRDFNPTNTDGTPFRDAYGIGLWLLTGVGPFSSGASQDWANLPISFSPNPVQCLWVGPLVSDFDCSHCVLGYEAISEDDATCNKPEFRPYRGWQSSEERDQLQLQDTRGAAIRSDTGSGATLLTDHTYTIPAPKLLQQKNEMFVGYAQPYSEIKYELDFSLGAEVDIGCGTLVVGDGAVDENIPKSRFAHPQSMNAQSFQWMYGRGNWRANPPDYGYYPQRCLRYHRFRVTRPGNFTFVSGVAWLLGRVLISFRLWFWHCCTPLGVRCGAAIASSTSCPGAHDSQGSVISTGPRQLVSDASRPVCQ